jgi:hypothetical protein
MPLLSAAADQAGTAQQVEMVRESRSRHSQRFLNLSDRHFAPGLNEKEKNLKAGQVRQPFQSFHMPFSCCEPGQGQGIGELESVS